MPIVTIVLAMLAFIVYMCVVIAIPDMVNWVARKINERKDKDNGNHV